ncbi:17828_t:CDS:2 [Racocetra persica]|uniref:17828_t:CDS:1 n=1 Tax=Racocetra persica TaxID=160502 RepID=A0ACA9QVS8_9GLOM|nr:17828_t:CDS:2 [Racocetra persica]
MANNDFNTLSLKYPCKKFMGNFFDYICNLSEKFDFPIIVLETKDVLSSQMEHSPESSQVTTQDHNIENDYGTPFIDQSDGLIRPTHATSIRSNKYVDSFRKFHKFSEQELNQQLEQFKNSTTDDHEITVQSTDMEQDGFTSMDPLIGSSSNVISNISNKSTSKSKSVVETVERQSPIIERQSSIIERQSSIITAPESPEIPHADDDMIIESVETDKNDSPKKRKSTALRQGGWTQRELNFLIKGMEKYGTSWSKIERKYGNPGGPLSRRTQVNMKDKARSELDRRLRCGLSPGFGKGLIIAKGWCLQRVDLL